MSNQQYGWPLHFRQGFRRFQHPLDLYLKFCFFFIVEINEHWRSICYWRHPSDHEMMMTRSCAQSYLHELARCCKMLWRGFLAPVRFYKNVSYSHLSLWTSFLCFPWQTCVLWWIFQHFEVLVLACFVVIDCWSALWCIVGATRCSSLTAPTVQMVWS